MITPVKVIKVRRPMLKQLASDNQDDIQLLQQINAIYNKHAGMNCWEIKLKLIRIDSIFTDLQSLQPTAKNMEIHKKTKRCQKMEAENKNENSFVNTAKDIFQKVIIWIFTRKICIVNFKMNGPKQNQTVIRIKVNGLGR